MRLAGLVEEFGFAGFVHTVNVGGSARADKQAAVLGEGQRPDVFRFGRKEFGRLPFFDPVDFSIRRGGRVYNATGIHSYGENLRLVRGPDQSTRAGRSDAV